MKRWIESLTKHAKKLRNSLKPLALAQNSHNIKKRKKKFNLNTYQDSGTACYLMIALYISMKFKLLTNDYLKNGHSPWKNIRARAPIWLLAKQNIGTYTKSHDMKRLIIDTVIHCNWTKIWTNSLQVSLRIWLR